MGRNWTEIAKLSEWSSNQELRRSFAYADLLAELEDSLKRAYPACFVEGRDVGPVPLSVLKLANEDRGSEEPWLNDNILNEFKIDFAFANADPEFVAGGGGSMLLLPDEFRLAPIDFGTIVEIDSTQYVTLIGPEDDRNYGLAKKHLVKMDS